MAVSPETIEVLIIRSKDPFQASRLDAFLQFLGKEMPQCKVTLSDIGEEWKKKFNLLYGPGVVVNGRLEFVGYPRPDMFRERVRLALEARKKAAAAPAPPPAPPKPVAAAPSPSEQAKP